MNTTHLESFVYVAKYNSISKAAQQLNYSSSTVQSHIKALEEEFDTKLYDRTSSGIQLTKNGNLFLKHANQILDITDNLHNIFSSDRNILRVTASESVNVYLMHSLIQKFIKNYPNIEIEYTKAITPTALNRLRDNLCDLSLIAEPHFEDVEGIKSKFICKLPLSFSTSPKHVCFKQGLKTSKEYNTLYCTMALPIILEILNEKNIHFEEYFSSEKNIGDFQMLKDLAYEGHVITLMPTNLIENDLKSNKLRIIPELDCNPAVNIYMLTSTEHTSKVSIINSFEESISTVLVPNTTK